MSDENKGAYSAKIEENQAPDLEVVDDRPVDTQRGLGDLRELETAKTQAVETGDISEVIDAIADPSNETISQTARVSPKRVPSINKTLQFVLGGRVKVDTEDVPMSRRGNIRAKTFLGIGDSIPPLQKNDSLPKTIDQAKAAIRASELPPAPEPEPESFARQHAKLAILNTMNFLDDMILKSPPEARASLEERKRKLELPKNMPDDEVLYRAIYYGRSIGYYGPMLWFIPPNMTLHDLAAADILDESWWREEQNFPEGFTTMSPFDPPVERVENYQEPGYWAIALPGIMPGTTAKTFSEQIEFLPNLPPLLGLEVKDGNLHPKHRMIMAVRGVVDTLYLCAIAQYAKAPLTRLTHIARTAHAIKETYHKTVKDRFRGDILVAANSNFSHCRVCVEFTPDRKLYISDMVDDRPSQGVGLIVFFIPKIY